PRSEFRSPRTPDAHASVSSPAAAAAIRRTGFMERHLGLPDHSGLMLAARITLPHFSVSAATKLPKSEGEPAITVPPRSASRALSWGSARAALISLLSLLTISAGVPVGPPTPYQPPVPSPLPRCSRFRPRPSRLASKSSRTRCGGPSMAAPHPDLQDYRFTDIADCCARAARGHAAIAPPSRVMNSRR